MAEYKRGVDFDCYAEWIKIGKQKLRFFANYQSIPKEGIEVDWDDENFDHDKYFDQIILAQVKEESGNRYTINYECNEEKQELKLLRVKYLTPQEVTDASQWYEEHKEVIEVGVKEFLWG